MTGSRAYERERLRSNSVGLGKLQQCLDMSSVAREVMIVADNVDVRLTTMGRDASISVNEAAEIMLQLIDR